MRHLYVVIDMSAAMESQDLKPTRLLSTLKVCVQFAVIKVKVYYQLIVYFRTMHGIPSPSYYADEQLVTLHHVFWPCF